MAKIQTYESPWPNKEIDALLRCRKCGQLLTRCPRDGCGEQVESELQRAVLAKAERAWAVMAAISLSEDDDAQA